MSLGLGTVNDMLRQLVWTIMQMWFFIISHLLRRW